MKLAYIILSHKAPYQLARLVSRLHDEGVTFVIHLCRNMQREDYRKTRELLKSYSNVFFCKREDGSWGEFGITQAVLNGMELLLHHRIDFDYLNVLSGNDYPIKSNAYLRNFFENNKGRQFLWVLPVYDYIPLGLPEGQIYGEGWKGYVHPWGSEHRFLRFEKYWYSMLGERLMIIPETRFLNKPLWNVLKIFLYNLPAYYRQKKVRREFLLMLLSLTHQRKRETPQGFTPYAGSQWFSVTRDCTEYIVHTARQHPELKKFFKHTLLSDESFFSTILAHSPYMLQLAQCNYRYIRWSGSGPRTHPVILTREDLPALKASDKLFARKFDISVDSTILDLIDREILFKSREHEP
ncbi:MAG: hypothetical protein KatS3mg031_1267 [Chitinophagales bacterium]|nr:MAG: hypothetical protein KatS3mg031_1267 [Chitinophagales bacterium]